jgi:hypothetical protein
MPASSTSFQKGQSGNPNGRPRKDRALTTIVEQAGSAMLDVAGKRINRKRVMAQQLWQFVTTGMVTFHDGRTLEAADAKEWTDAVFKLLAQIDGPPKQGIEHSGSITSYVVDIGAETHADPAASLIDATADAILDEPG